MAAKGTLTVRIVGDAKSFSQTMKRAEQTTDQFGRKIEQTGRSLTTGLTLPLAAVGAVAAKAASDQEQAFGAIDSVLGDTADTVKDFGDQAAESYGLSREQVARLGAVTAAQLKSYGFANEEAAETTIELQKRAADLAATFGGPVEDAVGAISALMRGERDPIEKYGVAIKQADVNARLAAQGLDHLDGEARKTAEAQAQLALLMEQTADAGGAFSRELDTAAGSLAVAKAEATNAAAELGEALLPLVAKAAGEVADLASAFSSLPEPLQSAIVQVGLFGAALGPIMTVGGRVARTVPAITGSLKKVYDTLTVGSVAAKGASTALGGVASSTMAVSSVLGPLGLVVAAGASAWAIYRHEQKEVKERIDRVRESLDAETAALTDNTRETLAAEVDSDGLRAALDTLGLTIHDVTGALVGEADAAAKVQTALTSQDATARNAAGGYTQLSAAAATVNAVLDEQRGTIDAAVEAQRRHIEDTTGLTAAQQEAEAQQSALIRATKGVTATTGDAADAADDLTGAMDDEADAADTTAREVQTLSDRLAGYADAQMAAVDPTFRLIQAQRQADEALSAYNDAVKEHGSTSKEAQSAAIELAEAELRAGSAAAQSKGGFGIAQEALRRMVQTGQLTQAQADAVAGAVNGARREAERYAGHYMAELGFIVREPRMLAPGKRSSDRSSSGFRAHGGNVGPGQWLVGERGPELVEMPGMGSVTPVGAASGGDTYNITISAPNWVGTKAELIDIVKAGLAADARRGGTLIARVARQ